MKRFNHHDPKEGPLQEPAVEEVNENVEEGKISDVDDGGESAAAGSLDN
jgi:hypothetical protein